MQYRIFATLVVHNATVSPNVMFAQKQICWKQAVQSVPTI